MPLPRRMYWESGACFSFIRQTSPLYAPRSWKIWQTSTINSRPSVARFTPFPAIPTLSIRRGMTPPSASRRSSIPCWPIPHIVWQRILRSTLKPTAWRSGAASLSTPREKSWPMRSTPAMWAGTPTSCCGRCRPASSWRSTETRCARRRPPGSSR